MGMYMLVTPALACAISLLITAVVRQVAVRRRWSRSPAERPDTATHLPRLGGVAVVFVLLPAVPLLSFLEKSSAGAFRVGVAAMMYAVGAAFVIGLVDDFHSLRARAKLAGQIAAGMTLCAAGVTFWPHAIALGGIVACGATVFWVVALCNAFNLVDGIDGLAGGLGTIAALATAVVALRSGAPLLALIALALAGALLGFLRFNFRPASIFLGDCGSFAVGTAIASLLAVIPMRAGGVPEVVGRAIIVAVPLTDAALAIVRRCVARRPIFSRDHNHIHFRLLAQGCSVPQAALVLYAAATFFGVVGAATSLGYFPVAVAVTAAGAAIVAGVLALGYAEDLRGRKRVFIPTDAVAVPHERRRRARESNDHVRVEDETVEAKAD